MRDYSKIAPSFWTRGSGKRLRGDTEAQVVALYLLSSPTANMVGIYYLALVTVAHEVGMSVEKVRAALTRIAAVGFAFYDEDAELAWVPNMAEYQVGERLGGPGDKRRTGVESELAKVGRHRFVGLFLDRYADSYGVNRHPFEGVAADEETPSKGKPSKSEEQEQEQEQEQEYQPPTPSVSSPQPAKSVGRRKTKSTWPETFAVSPAIEAMARAEQLPDPHVVFRDFHDKALANSYAYADWEAAFRTWMRSDLTRAKYRPWHETGPSRASRPPDGSLARPDDSEPTVPPSPEIRAQIQALFDGTGNAIVDMNARWTGTS
jgi:hypothetical protein